MIFAGILILGEFLEQRFQEHFNKLKKKQKELGVKLPEFPKPIFIGSTKNPHTMKSKPGNKSGNNVMLIQFESARISDHTFGSIRFTANFKIFISTQSFMTLANISDVIMGLHNAPINIEEHQNVFTEKGYVKPNVHVLQTTITSIVCLNAIDKSASSDAFRFVVNISFDIRIDWEPNLKI